MGSGEEVNQDLVKQGYPWDAREELHGPLASLRASLALKMIQHAVMLEDYMAIDDSSTSYFSVSTSNTSFPYAMLCSHYIHSL